LSGGQQQRVALARALVKRPDMLLLDEPLSNLDARLRHEMRGEIKRLQKEVGITAIFVTHDQLEALTMADRVALMRDGVLQAYATPTELYARPVNQFVAEFIGTPPMNFFAADLAPRNGSLVARTEGIELALPAGPRGAKAPPTATVGIRPRDGRIVELKVHRATWSGEHPQNSLAGLRECYRERVARVEIDFRTAGDDFVVTHDAPRRGTKLVPLGDAIAIVRSAAPGPT